MKFTRLNSEMINLISENFRKYGNIIQTCDIDSCDCEIIDFPYCNDEDVMIFYDHNLIIKLV